jgi:hypothetical protein
MSILRWLAIAVLVGSCGAQTSVEVPTPQSAARQLVVSFGELHEGLMQLTDGESNTRQDLKDFVRLIRKNADLVERSSLGLKGGLAMPSSQFVQALRMFADTVSEAESVSQLGRRGLIWPTIAQGYFAGLVAGSDGQTTLQPSELISLRELAIEAFGDQLLGDGPFNGDTGFAEAISLIYIGLGFFAGEEGT